jgi:hypothetical protein
MRKRNLFFTNKPYTMKQIIYILLLLITVGFTQCCKEKPGIKTDVPGLPPATQTGANTLGFLLNGVPWMPEGSDGTANLSIDFDPGLNNGTIGIVAKRFRNANDKSSFGIGIIDSLNLLPLPLTRTLFRTSIFRAGFSKFDSCVLFSHYDSVWSSGELTISKLDRVQRIVSGKFEFVLFDRGCDSVKITNGRFDMKF